MKGAVAKPSTKKLRFYPVPDDFYEIAQLCVSI